MFDPATLASIASLLGTNVKTLCRGVERHRNQIKDDEIKKYQHGLKKFVNSTVISQVLRGFYSDIEKNDNLAAYSISVDGEKIPTSMLISTSPDHSSFDLRGQMYSDVSAPTRNSYLPTLSSAVNQAALQAIARHERLPTKLWNDPLYRLVKVGMAGKPLFTFDQTEYVHYRWTWGLLEDEIKKALVDTEGNANIILENPSLYLDIRQELLPSISSISSLDDRLCCGGVEVTTAFVADDHFIIPYQVRSAQVSDGQGELATLPKGWHQPITSDHQNAEPYWTTLREYYEELFSGERVKRRQKKLSHDWWLHDEHAEPVRSLIEMEKSQEVEISGLAFGFNMVAGNFEFSILILVKDQKYYRKYCDRIEAMWESDNIYKLSTRDTDGISGILKGGENKLVNESIPSFVRSLKVLERMDPGRVDLPSIDEIIGDW